MSTIASDLLIRTYAKRLKLPAVAASAERLAIEAAAAGHGPLEFLAALLGAEVAQREVNVERARIQAARFPELKELSDFDFSLVPSLNAALVAELARGAWIERHEVVLAVGPPGTGKTHICTALGLAACRQSRRVRFVTVADLVTELSEAQAQHRLSRPEQQLDRLDLLILDELGFVKLSADQPSYSSSCSPIATPGAHSPSPPTSSFPTRPSSSTTMLAWSRPCSTASPTAVICSSSAASPIASVKAAPRAATKVNPPPTVGLGAPRAAPRLDRTEVRALRSLRNPARIRRDL